VKASRQITASMGKERQLFAADPCDLGLHPTSSLNEPQKHAAARSEHRKQVGTLSHHK
jgi:hypothetical protein